jgi:hypothetical protein
VLHVRLLDPADYFRRETRRRKQERTEKYDADLFHDGFSLKHATAEMGHARVLSGYGRGERNTS